MMMNFLSYVLSCFLLMSCKKNVDGGGTITNPPTTDTIVNIVTDKAVYKPGDAIHFSIDKTLPLSAKIRFRKLEQCDK